MSKLWKLFVIVHAAKKKQNERERVESKILMMWNVEKNSIFYGTHM
jgi:hypothetical protein